MAPTPAERDTVLVVEDDDAVRDAVIRGLALHGLQASAVGDAEAALAEVARRRPAVLVVDVGLPGMSGIDFCRRLRELDVRTPLLILSARDEVGDRVAGLQAGADDYLVKPFDLVKVAQVVERALAERAPRNLSRRVIARAAEIYRAAFTGEDGRATATFEIITATGWAPHANQQQPLRPGSAQTRLADALGASEIKAGEKAGR